jgi:restriction system protein
VSQKSRKRDRKSDSNSKNVHIAVSLVGLFALSELIHEYPVTSTVAGFLLLLGVAWFFTVRFKRRREAERLQAELDRQIALTDDMSGRDFEHWTARLLDRSGCTDVQVVGGACDAGADLSARSPDGHRVVVQCKRYNHIKAKVSSPEVQRFSGTARIVHKAEIALMITTAAYTAPAKDVARKAGIALVDRSLLAEWALTGVAPPVTGLLPKVTR